MLHLRVIVSKLSKIFRLYLPPFFKRSAKVRAFIIPSKFLLIFFEVFSSEMSTYFEELCAIFLADCKDRVMMITGKFLSLFFIFFLSHI